MTHASVVEAVEKIDISGFEVVYVDDGSKDSTPALLADIANNDDRVKVVFLSRNFGHQPAVNAGLVEASGDVVVVLDADLQDPPSVIGEMLAKWHEGYDVVFGIRKDRKESVVLRLCYAGFYRLLGLLSSIDIPRDSGDFALMDRRVVDAMNALPENSRFHRGLRSWVGFRQIGLPYSREKRAAGESKYPFFKLLALALDGIINFSTAPLSLISAFGICAFVLSVGGFLFFLANKLFGSIYGINFGDNPGFTTLILTLLFIGGVQLLSLGILGEYIGRIYQEVKRRPSYVVSRVYQASDQSRKEEKR